MYGLKVLKELLFYFLYEMFVNFSLDKIYDGVWDGNRYLLNLFYFLVFLG